MDKKGFTMIELLIATTVMVTILLAVVYSLMQAQEVTSIANNQDIALSAIQDKLEEIANDLGNIMNYDQQTFAVEADQGGGVMTPLLNTPPGLANPGQVTVNQIAGTNLFDVTVTVSWEQKPGRIVSRDLSTTFIQ
ncbi:prepilin-type N-terminal cleavage/methylation domain-containing protein [Candidatus Omnitrophota bacterium]